MYEELAGHATVMMVILGGLGVYFTEGFMADIKDEQTDVSGYGILVTIRNFFFSSIH